MLDGARCMRAAWQVYNGGAPSTSVQQPFLGCRKTRNRTCRQLMCHAGSSLPSSRTPLLDAVLSRGQQTNDVPFHVPGHKRGRGIHPKFQQLLDEGPLKCDLTEISGLDFLGSPTGVIADAQQLAATTFGADKTWFLVNGCSVGIHAAVMAAAGPGETLVVARNCHQSAFAAMTIAGCSPWWVQPEVDAHLGVAHGITAAQLEASFKSAQEAGKKVAAVLVVSPTYFGAALPIKDLAGVCHTHGVPLLVDEAHGGHFGLHPAFPRSALQQGADISIQSTHKVLSAMTQAAMLHLKGTRVDSARISRALQVLQSSSPSYLLMSSLDAARALADDPEACYGQAVQAALIARQGLAQVAGVSLLGGSPSRSTSSTGSSSSSTCGEGGDYCSISAHDPLRLTICVTGQGMSGFEAAEALEQGYGIVPELATQRVVVLALGPGSQPADAHALVAAVRSLADRSQGSTAPQAQTTRTAPEVQAVHVQAVQALSPRDAFFAQAVSVGADEAVGRVSSELLCPYPPGVPVVFPGEVITGEALQVLRATLAAGGTVTGARDPSLVTLQVIAGL